MTEWREVALGDLCERVTVGHVGKMADQYVDEGVPFLRSQNIHPFRINTEGLLRIDEEFHRRLSKSMLRTGDVAIIRTGYPGTAAVVPPEFDSSNCADLVIVTPSEELNPHVLAGVLNSSWGRSAVGGHLVGAAQQHFNVGSAKALRVRLPGRATQDRIADVLCSMNDLIGNNRRRVEVLEEMARAIYREWFVHFRFPGHEDATFVDSDLGPIPEGWSYVRLVDAANITMGQSPKSEFYNDDGVGLPFHQGVTHFGTHYPSHVKYCSVENRIADEGDILVSVRAPVGRLNTADCRLVIGRGVAAARSKDDRQALLLGSLQIVFSEEDSMGGGTIFKAITKKELENVLVPKIPNELAALANARLGEIRSTIRCLTYSAQRLEGVRDLLLPRLVTGQIDVSGLDLDAVVEKAGV